MNAVEWLEMEALQAGEDLPSLADLIDRPPWMLDALCREYPEVSFFPDRGQPTAPAKRVCAACLVRAECLAYVDAMDDGAAGHGIWGGTSAKERRQPTTTVDTEAA